MAREWSTTRSSRHSSGRYAPRGVTLGVVHRMAVLARGARAEDEEPDTGVPHGH